MTNRSFGVRLGVTMSKAPVAVLTGILVSFACNRAATPQSAREPTPQNAQVPVASTGQFEFFSDPWVNLHHFLYQWAREELGLLARTSVAERLTVTQLLPEEHKKWLEVLELYRDSVALESHFDPELVELKRHILHLPVAPSPPEGESIIAALNSAMPVYRKWWWPVHDSTNRAWIATVAPILRRHQGHFVQALTDLNNSVWIANPRRIDVSTYVHPGVGYTTIDGHIVIDSKDSTNHGLYGLETILHELQHTADVAGSLPNELIDAFTLAGSVPPPNVGHALIFATAGELTRSAAGFEGFPDYRPYWVAQRFDTLEDWRTLVGAVNEHWLPVLRGQTSKASGLLNLARSLK